MTMILPTLSKAKHAHALTYPFGAAEISRMLEGVPQFARIGLHFQSGNWHLKGPAQRFPVLEARYRRPAATVYDSSTADASLFEPNWTFWIYAVPRGDRHEVRSRLLSEDGSLPLLRNWFASAAVHEGRTGDAACTIAMKRTEVGLRPTHEESWHLEPRRGGA